MRLTLLFLVCACYACGVRSTEQLTEAGGESRTIDKIRLVDLDGRAIDPTKYDGKVLFINVWATWCAPCVREMPSIAKAKQTFDSSRIEFLFASNEAPETIRTFASEHPYDVAFVRLENLEEISIQAMPTTFIFNSRGELVFSEAGFRQWDGQNSMELIERIVNDK